MTRWGRLHRGQKGQTSAEFAGILLVVGLVVAALVLANPAIGETVATATRTAMCRITGTACDGGGVAVGPGEEADGGQEGGAPADGDNDDGGDGGGGDGGGDGGDDGGFWPDWVATGAGQVGEFFQGAGSQVWDEVKGLGETAGWIWDTVTSEEQRRENGEMWEAIKDDPGAALSAIWDGIWDPIQQDWNEGREASAIGRGGAAILTTIFGGKGLTKLRRLVPDAPTAPRVPDAPGRRPDAPRVACAPNSFLAATPVLLADGTALPIAEVDVGDQVLAADPVTGQVSARPVTHLITGTGAKQLTDVTVAGATLTATDGHPFYLPTTGSWAEAADLSPGDLLLTPTGTHVPVQAVASRTATTTVHNLTVADLHTYYVLAGSQPVLVHNADPGCTPEEIAAARRALDGRIDTAAASTNAGTAKAGEVAQWIRGRVRDFERPVGPNGSITDIDILTEEALIEVTTVRTGKLGQIQRHLSDPRINPDGKPVILYAENYTNRAAVQAIRDAGAYVVRSRAELESLLSELAAGRRPPP